VLAICLTLGVGLGACDDGREPQTPPASEDSVGVTDDAAATSRGSADTASRTTDPGVPKMPPAAKEDSEAGAEAFAKFYIEMVNYLGQHPKEGVLEKLSTDGCSTCKNYEESISQLKQSGRRRSGPVGEVAAAQALGSAEGHEALLEINVPAYTLKDERGRVVDEFSAGASIELRFDLQPTAEGHLVRGVYVIDD